MDFSSDTSAPAHPAILEALAQANHGSAPSYGDDQWTDAARQKLCDVFECDLEVWFTGSGTAANALGLSLICPPTGAVLCHEEAHIERDERGAVTFFSGGAQLSLLAGEHGRIAMDALEQKLAANRADFVHETPACALSLSNLTEAGAAYRQDDVRERANAAHAAGLLVHVDGARFANVVEFTRSSPAELSWKAGVDVMSFGVTKNGAMGCEAVLLFGEARTRAGELKIRAKRAGLMPPKMRFIAAQMLASLQDDLWLNLAAQANTAARSVAHLLVSAGGELVHPVEGNEVFARMPEGMASHLQANGGRFHGWSDGSWRLVCSWNTGEAELRALASCLSGFAGSQD